MRIRPALVMAALCAVTGCTIESGETVLRVTPLPEDPEIHFTSDDEPPLTLYLSNQSFEDDPVLLTLSIDSVALIDGRFYVESQHNWLAALIELPPGEHTITASSDSGATLTETFEISPQQRLWAVLDYWYDGTSRSRKLTWFVSDEPVGFG